MQNRLGFMDQAIQPGSPGSLMSEDFCFLIMFAFTWYISFWCFLSCPARIRAYFLLSAMGFVLFPAVLCAVSLVLAGIIGDVYLEISTTVRLSLVSTVVQVSSPLYFNGFLCLFGSMNILNQILLFGSSWNCSCTVWKLTNQLCSHIDTLVKSVYNE